MDVKHGEIDVARCVYGIWIQASDLVIDNRVDVGQLEFAAKCRKMVHAMVTGKESNPSEEQIATENDPEYLSILNALCENREEVIRVLLPKVSQ
jgi:hypothetical protein